MTAQLILANGFGVAVASDSASTMTRRRSGRRTYETAEKIRPLSDPHRLAVLQCGGVHLLRMPVGVLIDEWKATLGSRLQTVEGYRDNFLTWLGDNLNNWSTPQSRDWAAFNSLEWIVKGLSDSIQKHLQAVHETDAHAAVLDELRNANQELESLENHDPRLQDLADAVLGSWGEPGTDGGPSIASLIDHLPADAPRSPEIDREIHRFIRLSVEGGYGFPSRARTTVTFVGYGQSQMFPSAASVELFGAVGSHVARTLLPPVYAEAHGSSFSLILPLAQRDVIDQLLTGLNTPMTAHAADVTAERLGATHVDPERPPEAQLDLIEDLGVVASLRDEMLADQIQVSRERYLEPTYAAVAGMPLGSLAEAAGALIAMQNLALDIRGQLPTVGGNINVGTVTLSAGFEWVSHKGHS